MVYGCAGTAVSWYDVRGMGLISLLFSRPWSFLALAVLLLYSVIAHETAHGAVAYLFGDDTAKRRGRLTLNPIPHLDPVGALMLFLVGFGWAKPVPVDYGKLKRNRLAFVSVALAGCAANVLLAVTALSLLHLEFIRANSPFSSLLPIVVSINVILAAFNLIPLPPLDGSKILLSFLPEKYWRGFNRFEPYGLFLLMLLLFSGFLRPVIALMEKGIYQIIS